MCRLLSATVVALAIAFAATAHGANVAPAPDRVVLDVIVADSSGHPLSGLHAEDFQIKEDGHPVAIDSCEEVGSASEPANRSIVLLLDDSGVSADLTARVQQIARQFVNRASPGDRIDVVRLNVRADELTGDVKVGSARIAQYRAGAIPFFGRETLENAMTRIARLSHDLASIEERRKEIVAIGAPGTFDVSEPVNTSSLLWPYWIDAISESSRANTSLYVIDPTGLTSRLRIRREYGIVAKTGGDWFYNTGDFGPAVERIRLDAGHYYLLGYSPPRRTEGLHSVQVSMRRSGVRVRARKARG